MFGRKRTNARPSIEPLEARDVMSGLLVTLQASTHVYSPGQVTSVALGLSQSANSHGTVSAKAVVGGGTTTGTGSTTGAVAGGSNQTGLYTGNGSPGSSNGQPAGPNAATTFPLSPLLGTGTPTKAELAREKFVAHFAGPLATLPPRFSDQSKIIYMRGLGGSTPNFFLRGDYSLAIAFPAGFNPKSPNAINPGTGQPYLVTGFAFLDDKNNNSGGIVGLDLLADPTSFDAQGRPTRLTFTSDANVYGGIFFVSQSSGVVTITYGKNSATTNFNGRIYTNGLTSPFQNTDLYAKHSG